MLISRRCSIHNRGRGVDGAGCATKRPMRSGQRPEQAFFNDTCLVDAFRSVGVKVPYVEDGPFWVLADGAQMLAPFGPLV